MDTLDILHCLSLLIYVFVAFLSPGRPASPIVAPSCVRHILSVLLAQAFLSYAREPGHCCAGNYCRSRKRRYIRLLYNENQYDGARGHSADGSCAVEINQGTSTACGNVPLNMATLGTSHVP